MIKAYSANTAKIGVDGVPLGAVTLAEEYEDYSEYPVRGFGDSCPSAILTFDRSYSVILEREVSVGDGVRLENIGEFELQIGGRIYSGCNIENASYGLTNCAERTAVFNMVSQGCQHLTAIAVCGGDGKPVCFPCGACRQVIAEFAMSKEIPVLICGADGSWLEMTADELLPHSFELAGE